MKFIFVVYFLLIIDVSLYTQDTLIIEEKLVPLNYTEVMKTLQWPKENPDYEGKVYIKLLIGANGEVEKLGDIKGPDIFYEEVRKAAGKFIFTPVQVNGRNVRVVINFSFTFRLKEP
jgi:hypothetical protein